VQDIQNDLATRATDLGVYVRFAAVFVVGIGALQVWAAVRDARWGKFVIAAAVTAIGVLALLDPRVVLDRV
jgi:hypothetical protein